MQPDVLGLEDCPPVALATFCANPESHIVNAKLCYADVFRMLLLSQMLVTGARTAFRLVQAPLFRLAL